MKIKLIGKLFMFMMLASMNNSQAALNINESSKKFSDFNIEYLYDASASLSIEDVSSKSFDQKIPSQFALGYRDGNAWFKISVSNQSNNSQFILSFSEVFWTELDLYEYKENSWSVQNNGLRTPLNERSVSNATPSFLIQLPPYETKTYYIKGKTVSSLIGEFTLYTEDEYFRANRITIINFYNIYSGILFFIMLLISFLYFTVREKIYVYYICYVMAFITWISVQSGMYLNFGFPGWNDALHVIGSLVVLFLILFSKNILELEKNSPLANKLFKLSALIVFLCAIAITVQIPYVNLFFNLFSSLFFAMLLVVSIKAWKYSYFKQARYYLIALIIYMPSMALMTMTYNGLLDNTDITRYAFVAGSLVEILFFSFILVSKYGEEKVQRVEIQSKLNTELEQFKNNLENEVLKRTSDLSDINKQLQIKAEELEKAKFLLSKEATTDTLSGLLNRRYFLKSAEDMFDKAKKNKKVFSVLMMDIDRFKGINDNFGHKTGDKVIKTCSKVFENITREQDIVARYGGEEFVVLLPETDKEEALELAEKIRNKVETCSVKFNEEKDIRMTLSIGVATFDIYTDRNFEEILHRSDQGLYIAKNTGRNSVIFL